MSPMFWFMRRYAARTSNELYLMHVDPAAVERMKMFPPGGVPVAGRDALCGAVGGPWDGLTISVESHYFYQSIQAHLESDVPWSETQIYHHPKYNDDPERARRRCNKNERLIESIDQVGYRLQFDPETGPRQRNREMPSNECIGDVHVGDEIIVGLDRNGDPLHLKNGRHRLAVAQLLGVERIPVIVSLFHPGASETISSEGELTYSN